VNAKLQQLFDKIEDQKQDLFEMISNLSAEQINEKPLSGKWSISEIISHLITAEKLSVNYIQKKIQGVNTVKNSGLFEELKMLVLKISQRIEGLKFKAPGYVVNNTVVYSDIAELKKEWSKTREDFRQLLERMEDKHLEKKIYKHAIAGYLNIQHALMFFREHVTHHRPQIGKLIKTLK